MSYYKFDYTVRFNNDESTDKRIKSTTFQGALISCLNEVSSCERYSTFDVINNTTGESDNNVIHFIQDSILKVNAIYRESLKKCFTESDSDYSNVRGMLK
jgi:hypothetical protein